VARICLDYDFDDEKIEQYFKCFEVDKKYQGIAAFEW
jgi:hypothetical protein